MDINNKYKIKNKETLNQKVYKIIKEMIMDGELKTGSKLNEEDIAKLIGVSATPVRETFRTLEMEGLVEIIPYRGVFLKKYSIEEIEEAYKCREVLECLAIELSINNLNKKDLEKLLEEIERPQEEGTFYELSNKFDEIIYQTTNKKMIGKLINQLKHIILHDRNVSAYDKKRTREILKEHKEILENLIKKDLEGAKEAIRKHIKNGYEYIKEKYNYDNENKKIKQ